MLDLVYQTVCQAVRLFFLRAFRRMDLFRDSPESCGELLFGNSAFQKQIMFRLFQLVLCFRLGKRFLHQPLDLRKVDFMVPNFGMSNVVGLDANRL